VEEVIVIIGKNLESVNCTAKQPPKKDNEQSPLQVVFNTMNFDAEKILIDNGSDVYFIDRKINKSKCLLFTLLLGH